MGTAGKSRSAQKANIPKTQGLNLNLVGEGGALGTVLSALNSTINPAALDINGFTIENGEPTWFGPDMIPDEAELMIVQEVLNTPSIDFSTHGGVSHGAALAQWQTICDIIQTMGIPSPTLSDTQEASLEVLIAGYCMLGDPASVMDGLILGLACGWQLRDANAALYDLFAPMPWPFSVGEDFTGPEVCCDAQQNCSTGRYSNYAKFIIAYASVAFDQHTEQPAVGDVLGAYRDMLHGDTCDQEEKLAQMANIENDFGDIHFEDLHFQSLTVETEGQFISPIASRTDHLADDPFTLVALADFPWVFDHWEVTPSGGTMRIVGDSGLTIDSLTVDTTVRAVSHKDLTASIKFKDRQLEQAVRAAANKFDVNASLLWGDVDGLTMLEARGLGIANLDGLQYLSSLTYLDLRDNQISDLRPLGALTNMQTLYLGYNNLTQSFNPYQPHPLAPLAGMTNLQSLDLGGADQFLAAFTWASSGPSNHLRNVAPLASLDSLLVLNLCGNDLDSLEGLSNKTSLLLLSLDDNFILWDDQYNPNVAQNISTLATMTNLMDLFVQNTGITEATLQTMLVDGTSPKLPALQLIALSGNPSILSLGALARNEYMAVVLCGDNPGLASIEGLAGKGTLYGVQLVNTAVTELATLGSGNLHGNEEKNGFLIALNNPGLEPTPTNTTCTDVGEIATHGIDVYRDFACETEVLATIAVSPEASGSVLPFVGVQPVPPGASGVLEAVQTNPDYVFSHWNGPVQDPSNPVTPIYIDQSITVTAVFDHHGVYTLAILDPDGGGTVSPAPGDWACRRAETRSVTANAAPGWVFQGWVDDKGASYPASNPITLTMDTSRVIKAVFAPADVRLEIGLCGTGTGTGTVSPAVGRHYYRWDDPVLLSATPDDNSCLTGWEGTDTDTWAPNVAPASIVVMTRAHYENTTPALCVQFDLCDKTAFYIAADGFGDTSPESGTYHYPPGTVVPLTANPYPGWRFDHWGEDQQPDQLRNPYSVTIGQQTAPRTVTASFVEHNVLDDFQTWLEIMYPDPNTRPIIGTYHIGEDLGVDQHDRTASDHDMPDLLRFAMLDECLKNPAHPLHEEVMRKYWKNVSAWYSYADGITDADTTTGHYVFPSAAELHTFAAYFTFWSESVLPYNATIMGAASYMFKAAHNISTVIPFPSSVGVDYVTGLGLEGDFDGDGFSNVDEWLHALSKDPTLAANFAALATLPDLHMSSVPQTWQNSVGYALGRVNDVSAVPDLSDLVGYVLPPHVTVTISQEGQGAVHPAGSYSLPKYSLDEWPIDSTQTECPNCNPATLAISAVNSATDWKFHSWQGMFTDDRKNASLNVVLDHDYTLSAQFVERPGVDALDLRGDLEYLTSELGILPYGGVLDMNGIAFDENGDELRAGNGIPDADEFVLLEAALKDATLDQPNPGGVINTFLWQAWTKNLAQVALDLDGEDQHIQRAIAAYMTLGDYPTVQMVQHLFDNYFQESLLSDDTYYDRTQQEFLAPTGDGNADGISNLDHWKMLASSDNPNAGSIAYPAAALAKGYPQANWASSLPAYALPAPSAHNTRTATSASSDPIIVPPIPPTVDCGNSSCGEPCTLGVIQRSCSGFSCVDECNTALMNLSPNTAYPAGTVVAVLAKADSEEGWEFCGWSAPGTGIDNSRLICDSFRITRNVPTITANFRRCELTVPYAPYCKVAWTTNAYREENSNTHQSCFYGPKNTPITLRFSPGNDCGADGWSFEYVSRSLGPACTVLLGWSASGMQLYYDSFPPDVTFIDQEAHIGDGGISTVGIGGGLDNSEIQYLSIGNVDESRPPADPSWSHEWPVTVLATPNPGYMFTHWNNFVPDGTGQDMYSNPIVIFPQRHGNEVPTASFFKNEATLRVVLEATPRSTSPAECMGYVRVGTPENPEKKYYPYQGQVHVEAISKSGAQFVKWRGEGIQADDPTNDPLGATVTFGRAGEITVCAVFSDSWTPGTLPVDFNPFSQWPALQGKLDKLLEALKKFLSGIKYLEKIADYVNSGTISFGDTHWSCETRPCCDDIVTRATNTTTLVSIKTEIPLPLPGAFLRWLKTIGGDTVPVKPEIDAYALVDLSIPVTVGGILYSPCAACSPMLTQATVNIDTSIGLKLKGTISYSLPVIGNGGYGVTASGAAHFTLGGGLTQHNCSDGKECIHGEIKDFKLMVDVNIPIFQRFQQELVFTPDIKLGTPCED